MTNTRAIKARMVEYGLVYADMAKMLGIGTTTFHLKINNKSEFKQSEIIKICKILNIPLEEAHRIFFA